MITYIAFGSNMGNREAYIAEAIAKINVKVGEVLKASSIIETKPYGNIKQDDYLNGIIKVDTKLNARELLTTLNEIEASLDRKRTIRWGPRTIDLDIILYGNEIIDEEDLHIPHIDYKNRDFVLIPLLELDNTLVDARTGEKIEEIYKRLKE